MRRILALAVFAMGATALHATTITYNAFVDCNNNCVTVSLSWQNLSTPLSFVEVDDNLGGFLFALNVPFPPQTTGSIIPNPQTISNLSPQTISEITNSKVFAGSLVAQDTPTFANLVFKDANAKPFFSTQFIAEAQQTVPEPAVWSLAGVGLAFLFVGSRRLRKFQARVG